MVFPAQSVTSQERKISPNPHAFKFVVLSVGGSVSSVQLISQSSSASRGSGSGKGSPQVMVMLEGTFNISGGVSSEPPGSPMPEQNMSQVEKQKGPIVCVPPVMLAKRLLLSAGLVHGPPNPVNSQPVAPFKNLY